MRGRRGFTPNRGGSLPHARYGVDLSKVPDTYVPPEPFTAYRAWNWEKEGVTSLNGVLWTQKIYVGEMGQSDEAARFRILLGDGLTKVGFTPCETPC